MPPILADAPCIRDNHSSFFFFSPSGNPMPLARRKKHDLCWCVFKNIQKVNHRHSKGKIKALTPAGVRAFICIGINHAASWNKSAPMDIIRLLFPDCYCLFCLFRIICIAALQTQPESNAFSGSGFGRSSFCRYHCKKYESARIYGDVVWTRSPKEKQQIERAKSPQVNKKYEKEQEDTV